MTAKDIIALLKAVQDESNDGAIKPETAEAFCSKIIELDTEMQVVFIREALRTTSLGKNTSFMKIVSDLSRNILTFA